MGGPIPELAAPFPRNAVSWRAQSLSKDGTKAMALAYIDARDVMNRLDDVVGPANWQDDYVETPSKRVLCTIRIRIDGDWISKTDGAGATDVEADKGGISDAFKRAAVKWGIGRYLYDMETPWVSCESYEASNGKKVWRRWTADPWAHVKGATPAHPAPVASMDKPKMTPAQWWEDQAKRLDAMMKRGDVDGIQSWPAAEAKALAAMQTKDAAIHAKALRFHSELIAQCRAAG